MKKGFAAIFLLVFSCCVLRCYHWYQNLVPEFSDIATFDPSQYKTTYQVQTFKLKPNNRQWTLKSFLVYDENNNIEREELYQFDEDGQAYYITTDGNRIDTPNLSWEQMQSIPNAHANDTILNEEYDAAKRITFRESFYPDPSSTELSYWYYRTDAPCLTGAEALCALASTSRLVIPPDEDFWLYDADWNPCKESTSYVIRNYDKYGNETALFVEDDCYMKTDAEGYLQMIIVKMSDIYRVFRVDGSGKPLWMARYSRKDGSLIGYSLWNYELQ